MGKRAALAMLVVTVVLAAMQEQPLGPPRSTVTLDAPTHHVQGLAIEGDAVWVSSVERATRQGHLYRFHRRTGALEAQVTVQDGNRYHPGGIALDGDDLWVPVAEYRPGSTSMIQRRDKRSLALRSQFVVEDHIGCAAVRGQEVFGGNWDARQIAVWNREGRLLRRQDNPTNTRYQDLKFDGPWLVGSGLRGRESGAVDWLHPETLALRRRMTVGRTDRGVIFTNEGMAIAGGVLYLLPEDAPSRLFAFDLPATAPHPEEKP